MDEVSVVQPGGWEASVSPDAGPARLPETPAACGFGVAGGLDVCEALDPMAARPATIRRQRRLHALIGELSARDMDTTAVAAFLDCSATAARNYLNDLLEAMVIRARRAARTDDSGMRNGYCLNGDTALVGNFLADLDASPSRRVKLKRGRKPAMEARSFGTRHVHVIADDRYLGVSATHVAVRRDPLVAALFGKETQSKDALA
jgi:hypothetical protein